MKRFFLTVFFTSLAFVAVGYAQQQTVDQGAPGKKGPWPVTGTVTPGSVDGGVLQVTPAQCRPSTADGGLLHRNTVVGATAVPVPASPAIGRAYIEICNSLQNSSNPILKCRADGTAPVAAATNPGDVLGVGDCVQYPTPSSNVIQCISDAVGTNATSYECVEFGP